MVRLSNRPDITTAVYRGRKPLKTTTTYLLSNHGEREREREGGGGGGEREVLIKTDAD